LAALFLYLFSVNKNQDTGFSRYERNGIIFLCLAIFTSIILKKYVVQQFAEDRPLTVEDNQKITGLQRQIDNARDSFSYNKNKSNAYEIAGNKYAYQNNPATTDKNPKPDFKIEINAASAADFEKLYGIGKVLSQRIVDFRDKLGGFYSIEQIRDVWGIQDSTYQRFRKQLAIKPAKIRKVNINTASFEELTSNPYFFSTIAKQIIGYRTKVRPFETVEDIRNLYYVKDHPEQFYKLQPYALVE
jgi:competence ComEA-like helix-hairpin-helix protein